MLLLHRRSRTVVVFASLLVSVFWITSLAGANTGATPAPSPPAPVASEAPALRALEPPSEPSLAPSPLPDVLVAPGRRSVVLPKAPAPQPVYAQVSLITDRGTTGPALTYPAVAATANAIRRMATRQVSMGRGRCARTVREALGWGLGDAYQWLSLDRCGFTRRPKGQPAQPGDIVVWPFTFGDRRTQHIGMAVGTSAGTKLLSNMTGNMQLSRLAPGYAAFYRNLVPAAPSLVAPTTQPVVQLVGLPVTKMQLRAAITTVPTAMP